jgi:hypothetical protein
MSETTRCATHEESKPTNHCSYTKRSCRSCKYHILFAAVFYLKDDLSYFILTELSFPIIFDK